MVSDTTVRSNGTDKSFEADLFKEANKLRGNLEPSEYKHVALGLLFPKYISEAFGAQHDKLQEGENVELIEELLQSILPASVSRDTASYAEKISNRYRAVSSIDWPDRPSAASKIKIELTRLLKVADCASELISTTIDQMIDGPGNLYKQRRASV